MVSLTGEMSKYLGNVTIIYIELKKNFFVTVCGSLWQGH